MPINKIYLLYVEIFIVFLGLDSESTFYFICAVAMEASLRVLGIVSLAGTEPPSASLSITDLKGNKESKCYSLHGDVGLQRAPTSGFASQASERCEELKY